MKSPDIARLHQRIDELVEKIGELSSAVAKSLAACESCRPFVLGGDGKPPFSDRLNEVQQEINDVRQTLGERISGLSMELVVLKSVREIGGRLFWSGIGVAGTISGGVVGVLLKWWLDAGR
jgi:hypothetical protein